MIALYMVSLLLFSALVAAAAWCGEMALRAVGKQGRWSWIAAIAAMPVWAFWLLESRAVSTAGTAARDATLLPAIRVGTDAVHATAPFSQLLLAAWVVASALAVVRLLWATRTIHRVRASARRVTVRGADVLLTNDIGPAIAGVLSPVVLMPSSMLDLDEHLQEMVIAHESEHGAARDPWTIMAAQLVVALMPWNPAAWWIERRTRAAIELDCDTRVIARGANALEYARLLVLVAHRRSLATLAPMLAESPTHLERRIAVMRTPLTAQRNTRKAAVAAAGVIVALIAACSSRVDEKPLTLTDAARSKSASSQPLFEFQVETAARQIPGSGRITYPPELRSANVEGVVLAQFVVNEDGSTDPATLKILKSDHALLSKAVQDAVPSMRFTAAETRGRTVRQLVQMPFTFSLSSPGKPSRHVQKFQ